MSGVSSLGCHSNGKWEGQGAGGGALPLPASPPDPEHLVVHLTPTLRIRQGQVENPTV